ncbi:MAG: exodeoxyribonuclease VII small subunit [Clostridia bacterium]|nr:exodeoxyribonuclease VII small subunit [Clostridia bacterium]
MKFEEAMKELEETVKKLENSDTTLDEAMDLFEKGVGLTKTCQKLLGEAQLKVTKLVGGAEKEEVDFNTEIEE